MERNNPDPFIPTGAPDTVQSRRPFPFIIDNGVSRPLSRIRFFDSGGNSWYEGLQVSLSKAVLAWLRLHVGLHLLKDVDGRLRPQRRRRHQLQHYQDKYNRSAEKGRVGFDARHVAVMSFIYDIPAPQALSSGFAGAIFSGWQTNGIITLKSGSAVHRLAGQHHQHRQCAGAARPHSERRSWRIRPSISGSIRMRSDS